jgi:TonB family protein
VIDKRLFVPIIAPTVVWFITAVGAEPAKQANDRSQTAAPSTKKPMHLVVNSRADAKQVFTFFPYPALPAQYQFSNITATGIYRLSVNEQGGVTEIQILKRFGVPIIDADALKTFVRWRAQPGPVRIVDVSFTIKPGYQAFRRSEGSHIPRP